MESELFLGKHKHPAVLISYENTKQGSKVRPVGHATHIKVVGKKTYSMSLLQAVTLNNAHNIITISCVAISEVYTYNKV